MSRAVMCSTQVGVALSLNVTVNHDGNLRLFTFPILVLTPILFWLWSALNTTTRLERELSLLADDLAQAIDFTVKVVSIAFRSLAFGFLGV